MDGRRASVGDLLRKLPVLVSSVTLLLPELAIQRLPRLPRLLDCLVQRWRTLGDSGSSRTPLEDSMILGTRKDFRVRVVVAEKPSVAGELARALGCTKKERGYFSGGSGGTDLVTYALGHLVRMAEPGEMDAAWGKPWRKETLPMVPKVWGWVAEPRTEEQFEVVKRLLNDRRVTEIVNATDAGREGEAIFRRIYELAGCTKPVRRFWTSSLTEDAIAEALGRLRPAAEFDGLGAAALARAQLDWLIGMNHTRASTLHNGVLCSLGRVQTPTLAMIVKRHHEIANWVKTFYYEVHADVQTAESGFVARALNRSGKHDFEKKDEAEGILADVPEGTPAVVTSVEKKLKRVPPPQLHNLGELQKEANRRFGLGADRTLEIAQTLYERKAITYPRSSSRYLSEDMEAGLGEGAAGAAVSGAGGGGGGGAGAGGPDCRGQGAQAGQAVCGWVEAERSPRHYPHGQGRRWAGRGRGAGVPGGGGTILHDVFAG